jgi:hypothetical protein
VGKFSKTKKEQAGGGWGWGENKVAKKTNIRVNNGQTKKINLGWHMDKKKNPISSPSIHVGALVGVGSL